MIEADISSRSRGLALAGALVLMAGCGSDASSPGHDDVHARRGSPAHEETARDEPTPDEEGDHHVPERALSYEPEGEVEGRLGRAIEAARRDPSSVPALDTLAALYYRRYRETGDLDHLRRAEDAIAAALDRAPDDAMALAMSGLLALTDHRFRDARDIARRILRADHQDVGALILLGDAQLELGEYDSALATYQRATDLRPDLRTYNRGAYMRWLHGDVEGALELLALATDAGSMRDPESTAWCLVDVANVHWQRGDRFRVRAALDEAARLVPDYAPALRLRAQLLAAEGDRAGAIAILEAMVERREQVGDLLRLAELLTAEGRADAAAARVARAVAIEREDPRALAGHRARHGIDTAAALAASEAELHRREDIWTLAVHAMALARSDRDSDARAAMDRALALGTPDVTLYLADALVRQLAGDREGARAAFERARVNPDVDRVLFDALARELEAS